MSELYSHLLITRDAAFVPELGKIAGLFYEFEALGALPKETKFTVVTHTGRTRVLGRNPRTSEVYYGPELRVSRFSDLQLAIDSVVEEGLFDLSAEGMGPTQIPPFDLYNADNYASRHPEALWKGPYSFSVRCKLRQKITHFLHSSFGCKCAIEPNEPGIFENPWNHKPIQTSGLACARFWIQIAIGDYLMPMVTDSLDILDTRLVAAANNSFGVAFAQGCICNDD
jgi:hypothetical protein